MQKLSDIFYKFPIKIKIKTKQVLYAKTFWHIMKKKILNKAACKFV